MINKILHFFSHRYNKWSEPHAYDGGPLRPGLTSRWQTKTCMICNKKVERVI